MNNPLLNITVAPILENDSTLIIYRNNGEEVVVKINKETKTISSNKKIDIDEVNFIRDNYL